MYNSSAAFGVDSKRGDVRYFFRSSKALSHSSFHLSRWALLTALKKACIDRWTAKECFGSPSREWEISSLGSLGFAWDVLQFLVRLLSTLGINLKIL
ncbi:hypothetical protein EV2_006991 [Malus domestica]